MFNACFWSDCHGSTVFYQVNDWSTFTAERFLYKYMDFLNDTMYALTTDFFSKYDNQ